MRLVAGVTVLYNCDVDIILNIQSYINQVELLYIITNSDSEPIEEIRNSLQSTKIRVLNNHKNIGIASALNQAIEFAISDGFNFLLMMDQDSRVSDNLVAVMMNEFNNDELIGILAPFVVHEKNPKMPANSSKELIHVAMTSGSMIKLSLIKKTGKLLDDFFIDYVDQEISLRMISNGFKIYQLNNVFVFHKLGNIVEKKMFGKKIFPMNYQPIRLYYKTRNRFYVYKTYKDMFSDYIKRDRLNFFKEIIKIVLFENNRIKKLYMILKGFYHYKLGISGKLSDSSL